MKKSSRFETFLKELNNIQDQHLTKDVVIDLLLRHFEGQRITCTTFAKVRMYRENLAYALLLKNTPRAEIANQLVARLDISKAWAINLVNRAIDRRARELKPLIHR